MLACLRSIGLGGGGTSHSISGQMFKLGWGQRTSLKEQAQLGFRIHVGTKRLMSRVGGGRLVKCEWHLAPPQSVVAISNIRYDKVNKIKTSMRKYKKIKLRLKD